jgi:hypothetical protein
MSYNVDYRWLAKLTLPNHPEFGSKMVKMMRDFVQQSNNVESQVNANATGDVGAPPPLQSMLVTPTSVGHHVSISHGSEFFRGCVYHVEGSMNASFANPFPLYTGPAREIDLATGKAALYFQAFASYPTSANTPPVFHGGLIPQPVTGASGGVPYSGTSQGSGTGLPGQGRQGFGSNPFRSSNGIPPVRGLS